MIHPSRLGSKTFACSCETLSRMHASAVGKKLKRPLQVSTHPKHKRKKVNCSVFWRDISFNAITLELSAFSPQLSILHSFPKPCRTSACSWAMHVSVHGKLKRRFQTQQQITQPKFVVEDPKTIFPGACSCRFGIVLERVWLWLPGASLTPDSNKGLGLFMGWEVDEVKCQWPLAKRHGRISGIG